MPARALTILVIDENSIRASIIEAGLREAGHDAVTVVQDVTGRASREKELRSARDEAEAASRAK